MNENNIGREMHKWATDLFPICRSITGNGVRQTLAYFKQLLPTLMIHEVPSGTQAFDWIVPDEWNIKDAFVEDENGNRVIDFHKHNLHVVGYSEPVDQWMTFEELDEQLYSLPDQPDAIPYITSYYKRRWGFCITEHQRQEMRQHPKVRYHVKIDSVLASGHLTYGELVIPSTSLAGGGRKFYFPRTYVILLWQIMNFPVLALPPHWRNGFRIYQTGVILIGYFFVSKPLAQ
jgi:hypothetical protein